MIIGVPKESFPNEARVALTPDTVAALTKKQLNVVIESGAGISAGFPDSTYEAKGAAIVSGRADVFGKSDVILQVRSPGANPDAGKADFKLLREGQVVIGLSDPLGMPELAKDLASTGATSFSMELIPRITRAQSMDVLSSQATIAGYKAVLIAAMNQQKMYPMMMTAAGTIAPAKVFIIGAGVAGLQAIASAKRLGAIIQAYDVRPAVKEQIESLGAKFVELDLETGDAEDTGGYAREMGEEFLRKQREMMTRVVAEVDAVITTAAIPGKKSPVLITADMVEGMMPGSVIVDLASERGGNCELTRHGETVVTENRVTIIGPENISSTIPLHASQMYAKNIYTFLMNMVKDGELNLDMDDEIIRDTLITKAGEVVQPRVREVLGLEPLSVTKASPGAESSED